MMGQKYELMEEQTIEMNANIFKKGMGGKEIEKVFDKLVRVGNYNRGIDIEDD